MGFQQLLYTDCLPGESLTGQAGFGFRAATTEHDPIVQEVIANHLLYEPPEEWMRQDRPVDQYPPMLAHAAHQGWYCTARGVYLGRERKGNREGNHSTQAVATDDPADYRGLRPAQLAAASFWHDGDPGTTRLPDPGPAWTFGERTADDAFATVRLRRGWRDWLAAGLAALNDDESRTRIVFVGDDPGEILRWITALTLLQPYRKALTTGFKAYTTRPFFGDHRIVAVHPGVADAMRIAGGVDGAALFDLQRDAYHGPGPDHLALAWIEQLDACDHLDLIDAIELADDSGLEPAAAQDLGLAAFTGRRPSVAGARALAGWLNTCEPGRFGAYAAPVVDALLEMPDRPHPLLIELDRLASSGRLAHGSTAVRLDLLAEELRNAQRGNRAEPGTLPPLPADAWDADAERRALDATVDVLHDVRGAGFDPVLCVADRFRLPRIDLESHAPDALRTFLDYWEHRPDLAVTSSYRDELRHRLIARLTEHRGGRGTQHDTAAAERWHPIVLRWFATPPIDNPFYRDCLAVAAARRGDDFVEQWSPTLLKTVPAELLALAATSLWQRRAARPDLIAPFVRRFPEHQPVGPLLCERLREPLLTDDGNADQCLRNLAAAADRGLTGGDPIIRRILNADDAIRARSIAAGELAFLRDAAPVLLRRHSTELVDALLDITDTATAVAVMNSFTPEANGEIVDRLVSRLRRGSWHPHHFALAFAFSRRRNVPRRRTLYRLTDRIAEDLVRAQATAIAASLANDRARRAAFLELIGRVNPDARPRK